jgi:hypothetical protein
MPSNPGMDILFARLTALRALSSAILDDRLTNDRIPIY